MSDAESSSTFEAEPVLPADPVGVEVVPDGLVDGKLTWVPFVVYLCAWIILAVGSAYVLRGATADTPARWLPWYPAQLWAAVALAVTGPVLSLTVWAVARRRRTTDARRGLFTSAMIRGALTAAVGATIWVGALYVIEYMTMNGVLG